MMSNLQFFWDEVVGLAHGNGFNPDEFNWRETDIHDKPFQWDTEQELKEDLLVKQIPKPNDFIAVCMPAFESALREVIFPVDAPPERIYEIAMEEVVGMVKAAYRIYNPDDPLDYINVFNVDLKKEVK